MGGYANPCYDPECPLEGRHEKHEREPTPRAGLILIVRDTGKERELLATTNRRYGGYALPGGKVDVKDPSPRFAARRELREETGIVAIDSDLTFLFKSINTVTGEDREVSVFFARSVWGQPKNIEPGTEFAWFTFYQFLHATVFKSFYELHLPDGIAHLVPTVMSQ